VNGVLLIDKPSGPTSFDVVRAVRRAVDQRKVGHTGTLDPPASGLLIVCLGQGTKLVPYLMQGDKRYSATVRLGSETDTDDAAGEPTAEAPIPALTRELIADTLVGFRGTIEQVPPAYSAIKSGGEALHRKARRGEQVDPAPRAITIHTLELARFEGDEIDLEITCSKGTYVRSLARDLGRALGTRAHLAALRRTASSGFDVADALPLAELESADLTQRIIPLASALPGLPSIELTPDDLTRVLNGNPIGATAAALKRGDILVRLVDACGELIAIARIEGKQIRPARVFPREE
jgi:tRNA pseudouridine55 synthase